MDYKEALRTTKLHKEHRNFPRRSDRRYRSEALFPDFQPKFKVAFDASSTVFTIGSCFARNIEEALEAHQVQLPARRFAVPDNEWSPELRPNGLLNEYTPGTIAQRIASALQGRRSDPGSVVPNGALFADLLLPGGGDVERQRALDRREEIFAIYQDLAQSQLAIVTLGYVESWYDRQTQAFLNRMPPRPVADAEPGRFEFRCCNVDESLELLGPAFDLLAANGVRTLITVSPVPIRTTFTASDCVTANEYSKAVLRVCAEELSRGPLVDYFPSYEIVRSAGLSKYWDDNVHVMEDFVGEITGYMVSAYAASGSTVT
jgi:hypothetical protein